LDEDETFKMAEYFVQDPLDVYKNVYKNGGSEQRRYDYLFNHRRKEESIAKFLYVRELFSPVIIIRDSLKRKREELRKHEQIVSG